jgi:SRSO17 transposase
MTPSPVDPDWEAEFQRWLEPFLGCLGRKGRQQWFSLYLLGQMSAECRRCATTMAREVAPDDEEQLHHFVSTSKWDGAALEAELVRTADALVGGPDSFLIIDDTALVKKGTESVGVARQYCGELGKKANCQSLVSLTLARAEVPVAVALRLFLPESWDGDERRRCKCGVPEDVHHRPKWKIALEELDRVVAAGARFGEALADAGYGVCGEFRQGLSQRKLRWTVGILPQQQVYAEEVTLSVAAPGARGRPRKHPTASARAVSASAMIAGLSAGAWRTITWREGTKGPMRARFAIVRVRVADGAKTSFGRRNPGESVWLICEERDNGERKYYLSNHSARAPRRTLATSVKSRWSCEQAHQQMKQELGLDHYEGRSWHGLHHHCLLTMIAYVFFQHLRLKGKKNFPWASRRPAPRCRKSGAG